MNGCSPVKVLHHHYNILLCILLEDSPKHMVGVDLAWARPEIELECWLCCATYLHLLSQQVTILTALLAWLLVDLWKITYKLISWEECNMWQRINLFSHCHITFCCWQNGKRCIWVPQCGNLSVIIVKTVTHTWPLASDQYTMLQNREFLVFEKTHTYTVLYMFSYINFHCSDNVSVVK